MQMLCIWVYKKILQFGLNSVREKLEILSLHKVQLMSDTAKDVHRRLFSAFQDKYILQSGQIYFAIQTKTTTPRHNLISNP